METENPTTSAELEAKIDALQVSVEKVRKYMLWSFTLQLVAVVVPILVLFIAIPFLLSTMTKMLNGLL